MARNNLINPNAREAMDRFKMESASEVGVPLKQGYNGNLTSAQAGSIGGNMVKDVLPVLRLKRSIYLSVVSPVKILISK